MKFPADFLFGASTASHQVEGNNHNQWTKWEHENATKLAGKAHLRRWPQHIQNAHPKPTEPNNYISGRAADHYHRYEQDFYLMKSLNLNAYRFSLEWSRIEPKEGQFNEHELAHYEKVLKALRDHHIEPIVTLWHWTMPIWIAEKGGVQNEKFPEYFAKYTEKVHEYLGSHVKFWITLNEPEIYMMNGYYTGKWPPQERSLLRYRSGIKNLILTHMAAYDVLKSSDHARVGISCNLSYFKPAPGIVNKVLADIASKHWNHQIFPKIKNHLDWIGLNFYFTNHVNYGFNKNPGPFSDMNWHIEPEGIYNVLMELKRYGKPIYITENGLADGRDHFRLKWIETTLESLEKAIEHGADVKGYCHWSLLDNFEWADGYWPRFGLIKIDYQTLERTVRNSTREYARLIKKISS